MGKLKTQAQYTPEEQQYIFTHMVQNIEAKMLLAGKPTPTTMQDIPALFEADKEKGTGLLRYVGKKPEVARDTAGEVVWRDADLALGTPEVIKTALWIAQKHDLIPEDTPLRQIWYSFIKLALQKAVTDVASADQLFSKRTLELIRDTGKWYSDFNIKNEPVAFDTPELIDEQGNEGDDVQIIPNAIIAMEKESYYQYLKKFADLMGIANYSAGGMSQGTLAETVVKRLAKVFPKSDFKLYSITDYDPAGFNISHNLGEHFNLFGNRLGLSFDSERVAPKPEHYEKNERDIAKYALKSTGKMKKEEQAVWIEPERVKERAKYDIDDKEGMEVESLPAVPKQEHMPDGMDKSEGVGQARMRLIILNKIIEDLGGISGLDYGLKNLMEKGFIENPEKEANGILAENSGIKLIDANSLDLWQKVKFIVGILAKANEKERDEIKDKVIEWKDNTIDDWSKDNDKLV